MINDEIAFGYGSFVGNVMHDDDFFEMSAQDQARVVGWADSCPVVTELTDPSNTAPGRGPDAMLERYGQVNFWFGELSRLVGELNPALQAQLMTPIERRPDEPVGKYETESVPDSHNTHISPMGTLAGYALPRLFIEQMGLNVDLPRAELQKRLVTGIDIVSNAALTTTSPLELLAVAAEAINKQGDVETSVVLKQILPRGWMTEHNSPSTVAAFTDILRERAPVLATVYDSLDSEQKALRKIL